MGLEGFKSDQLWSALFMSPNLVQNLRPLNARFDSASNDSRDQIAES